MYCVSLFLILILCINSELLPNQENVCGRVERYLKNETTCHDELRSRKTTELCINPLELFQCDKVTTYTVEVCVTEQVTKTRNVYECCLGYKKVNSTCIHFCEDPCIHGECISINECKCLEEYVGSTCNISCKKFMYGETCNKPCDCDFNNSYDCNKATGACICKPGYIGGKCQFACPPNSFGVDCSQTCECNSERTDACDNVIGKCICKGGYTGALCNKECPVGTAGQDCNVTCACIHGTCLQSDGSCDCNLGYEGSVCASQCSPGKWGPNCVNSCNECFYNGTCNIFTGDCRCKPGYQGIQCQNPCDSGQWGENCLKKCNCTHPDINCNNINGQCICPNYLSGSNCEIRQCPKGRYGPLCKDYCQCQNNATCDDDNGSCTCTETGWFGEFCEKVCEDDTFGMNCQNECHNCKKGEYCNRHVGCTSDGTLPLSSPRVGAETYGVATFIGIILTALVILSLISIVLLSLRYRNKKKDSTPTEEPPPYTPQRHPTQQNVYYGDNQCFVSDSEYDTCSNLPTFPSKCVVNLPPESEKQVSPITPSFYHNNPEYDVAGPLPQKQGINMAECSSNPTALPEEFGLSEKQAKELLKNQQFEQ